MSRTFGPYSLISQAGDTFYLAGHVGIDPATKHAADTATEQTKQVLANLQATLASHDLGPEHLVKTTVFVTDMDDAAAVNEVYASYFTDPRPARSMVAVHELPRAADKPLKVEIEAIAYKRRSSA